MFIKLHINVTSKKIINTSTFTEAYCTYKRMKDENQQSQILNRWIWRTQIQQANWESLNNMNWSQGDRNVPRIFFGWIFLSLSVLARVLQARWRQHKFNLVSALFFFFFISSKLYFHLSAISAGRDNSKQGRKHNTSTFAFQVSLVPVIDLPSYF